MTNRKAYDELSQDNKEKLVCALFATKYPGLSSDCGVDVDVAAYSLRAACVLIAEEEDELVKKIIVLLEEHNDFIESLSSEILTQYVSDLNKSDEFEKGRDELVLITGRKWESSSFSDGGKKVLTVLDMDSLLAGIEKHSSKDTKQAKHLRNLAKTFNII
ncbi:TPA: hypothetical protein H1011_00430 [archaeon]|jgi:hypothetical protein|uniref:Uncharacterized protein n=1 Tax=Candidatus Undinarchaeum marinum TaxID=2756141 RepID=A0A832XFL4_9ARCH|nr:hypothetical protein [Candidatus Undinarchaeum marinum]